MAVAGESAGEGVRRALLLQEANAAITAKSEGAQLLHFCNE